MDIYWSNIESFIIYFKLGVLALTGGISAYLYRIVRTDNPLKFSWKSFLIQCFLSFWVGELFGRFISPEMANRDGLLMLVGFCSFPICSLLESKYKSIFFKTF